MSRCTAGGEALAHSGGHGEVVVVDHHGHPLDQARQQAAHLLLEGGDGGRIDTLQGRKIDVPLPPMRLSRWLERTASASGTSMGSAWGFMAWAGS